MPQDSEYSLTVDSQERISLINYRELWEYRDLILLFVRRDFLAKYAQTILGPTWFVLQPLLTSVAFTVIFGHVAEVSSDGLPRLLFYLAALLPWGYFSHTLGATGSTYTQNRAIFTKVYFPRLAVPVSALLSNLIALGIQVASFAAFWIFFKFFTDESDTFHLTWWALLTPFVTIYAGIIAVSFGLWIAVITAKYRDLQHALPFITQLWMYGTPIIYSLGMVDIPILRQLLACNPMVMVTEFFRLALLGKSDLGLMEVGQSLIITTIALVTGLYFFQKIDRTVVDAI